ncbi:hypothetical protein DMP15_18545 [Pseudonocardia sp. UM4_GMWB1]|uniref:hypothetical protein n=1 Tax=Pseudonocardia sp. UM4_GMWB1 TaxID=2212989 RepID=UPI00307FB391
MATSAAEKRAASQLGAHTRWARETDRHAAMQPARDGLWQRFLRQADPDTVLPEHVRVERAESLRRAHFAELALRSARARRLRREAAAAAARAEQSRAAAKQAERAASGGAA